MVDSSAIAALEDSSSSAAIVGLCFLSMASTFSSAFTGGETGVRTMRDLENQVQALLAENNQLRAHLDGSQRMVANLNQQFYPFLDLVANPVTVNLILSRQRAARRAKTVNASRRLKALRDADPHLNARVNRYTQEVSKLLAAAVSQCQTMLNKREAFRILVREDEEIARNKDATTDEYVNTLADLAEQKDEAALEYKTSLLRGSRPAGATGTTIVRSAGTRSRRRRARDSEEDGEGEEGMESSEGSDEEAVESDEPTIAAEEEESSKAAIAEESTMDAEDL